MEVQSIRAGKCEDTAVAAEQISIIANAYTYVGSGDCRVSEQMWLWHMEVKKAVRWGHRQEAEQTTADRKKKQGYMWCPFGFNVSAVGLDNTMYI